MDVHQAALPAQLIRSRCHRARQGLFQFSRDQLIESNYGYCEECGETISFKQLLAYPDADMCLECKEDTESL